jgi:hypothetical protein
MPAETWPHKWWNPIINFDWHAGIFLTGPIPIPGFAWHLGFSMEGGSKIIGENKWNDDVLADGCAVPSRTNEVKVLVIPHWNMYPFTPGQPNLLMPLLILGSSSKNIFAVGSVIAKNGPVAVTLPFVKILGINMACADPCSMPTSLVIPNWSTVNLGFTWGDLLAGIIIGALDALKSYIEGKLFGKLFDKLPPGLFKGPMMNLLRRLGLPMVFRGQGGRFASLSSKMVAETLQGVTKFVYGKTVGGSWGDGNINSVLNSNPVTGILTGETWGGTGGLGDTIGAYVDGRAERVGGVTSANTIPNVPSPTPTIGPTPTAPAAPVNVPGPTPTIGPPQTGPAPSLPTPTRPSTGSGP